MLQKIVAECKVMSQNFVFRLEVLEVPTSLNSATVKREGAMVYQSGCKEGGAGQGAGGTTHECNISASTASALLFFAFFFGLASLSHYHEWCYMLVLSTPLCRPRKIIHGKSSDIHVEYGISDTEPDTCHIVIRHGAPSQRIGIRTS